MENWASYRAVLDTMATAKIIERTDVTEPNYEGSGGREATMRTLDYVFTIEIKGGGWRHT